MFAEVKGITPINASAFSRCIKISAGKCGNSRRSGGQIKVKRKTTESSSSSPVSEERILSPLYTQKCIRT